MDSARSPKPRFQGKTAFIASVCSTGRSAGWARARLQGAAAKFTAALRGLARLCCHGRQAAWTIPTKRRTSISWRHGNDASTTNCPGRPLRSGGVPIAEITSNGRMVSLIQGSRAGRGSVSTGRNAMGDLSASRGDWAMGRFWGISQSTQLTPTAAHSANSATPATTELIFSHLRSISHYVSSKAGFVFATTDILCPKWPPLTPTGNWPITTGHFLNTARRWR